MPELNNCWVEPDVRDAVVNFIHHWQKRFNIVTAAFLLKELGLREARFYEWKKRYGMPNRHNGKIPKSHWLSVEEKERIVSFYNEHHTDGYRRCSYMMIDNDIVYCSPSTVFRVLSEYDALRRWNRKTSRKGSGFEQPLQPHEHWHIDISYVNIHGTFFYLTTILDGYSRYIIHTELRESMKVEDVEIVVQKAKELFPDAKPRIISDNGKQFVAREFKELIRIHGMTQVTTSPYYPQSNGKIERFHKTIKSECIRKKSALDLQDAVRIINNYIKIYNEERLHSAIGYITPKDKLEGRDKMIHKERDRKLEHARAMRRKGMSVDEIYAKAS